MRFSGIPTSFLSGFHCHIVHGWYSKKIEGCMTRKVLCFVSMHFHPKTMYEPRPVSRQQQYSTHRRCSLTYGTAVRHDTERFHNGMIQVKDPFVVVSFHSGRVQRHYGRHSPACRCACTQLWSSTTPHSARAQAAICFMFISVRKF
jgi:hypothetical protein